MLTSFYDAIKVTSNQFAVASLTYSLVSNDYEERKRVN